MQFGYLLVLGLRANSKEIKAQLSALSLSAAGLLLFL